MTAIALMTDFGDRDWYVAAMKGILLTQAPGVSLQDITHHIPPGDIRAGAFVLDQCHRYFPAGTVFLAVVDPGVGTEQRDPVVVSARGYSFVGPDNGLFGFLRDDGPTIHRIDNPAWVADTPSDTFHGRDLFAPAAARLARGALPSEAGLRLNGAITALPWPEPQVTPDAIEGEIIFIDHFGNALTNITRRQADAWAKGRPMHVSLKPEHVPLGRTYADSEPGSAVALFGSADYLEIAVNQGHAARLLALTPGQRIALMTGQSSA